MNTLDILALIILVAPVVAFAAIAAIGPLRRNGPAAGAVVSIATAGTLVAAVALLAEQLAGVPAHEFTIRWLTSGGSSLARVGWRIDGISASMAVVVSLVALCVQVYSQGYLATEPSKSLGRYFAWHALFVFSMQTLVLAPNLLQLFMGWELVGLCSYLLIGYYWRTAEAGKASLKAFWVTKFADSFLLMGLVLLVANTGSFSWNLPTDLAPEMATAIALLLFIGAMGKAAQMPLHVWLPDAMAGPTPVSALLHAATMVAAGVYIVVRGWPVFEASPTTLTVMMYVGSITAFLAGIYALLQDDLKKLLAFSTCSQLGYMMAALGAGSQVAGYFHLTTHACFKALLFLGAGSVIHAVHSNSMSKMGGLRRSMPVTFVLFTLGSAALAGFPFVTAGFFSKDLVLEALAHREAWVPLGLCLAGVVITALYMTRAVLRVFFGAPREAHESPMSMMVPMLALGIPSLAVGWAVGPFRQLAGSPGPDAMEMLGHFVGLPLVGTLLMATGVGLAIVEHRRGSLPGAAALAPAGAWLLSRPLDRFYENTWRNAVLVVARAVGWVDRYIIDALINLSGWAVVVGGDRMRRVQTGRPGDYVWAISVGALALVTYGFLRGF